MPSSQWNDLATEIALGDGGLHALTRFGLRLKPGKTSLHVRSAQAKAFSTPPCRTDAHLKLFIGQFINITEPLDTLSGQQTH